jgi:hypothetical protein
MGPASAVARGQTTDPVSTGFCILRMALQPTQACHHIHIYVRHFSQGGPVIIYMYTWGTSANSGLSSYTYIWMALQPTQACHHIHIVTYISYTYHYIYISLHTLYTLQIMHACNTLHTCNMLHTCVCYDCMYYLYCIPYGRVQHRNVRLNSVSFH